MFYPGQFVYIPGIFEKRLGVYMGFGKELRAPYKPIMYVHILIGGDGADSYTNIYEPHDLRPIAKADKKSRTGQVTYRSPFQRDAFSKCFFDKEAEEMKPRFVEEMLKIAKIKWFKDRYELDTTITKKLNQK